MRANKALSFSCPAGEGDGSDVVADMVTTALLYGRRTGSVDWQAETG
jgi:hypothetical protein